MSAVVIGETVRRHVTNVFYVALLLLLVMIGFGVASFNTPGAVWPSLVGMLAVVAGAGVIGPEFSSGTLQLIVSRPLRRWSYLLSRVAGVVAVVGIAAALAFVAESVTRLLRGTDLVPWPILLNVLAVALSSCALLVFFASVTRAYFNIAIYFMLQIGFSATEGILALVRGRGGATGEFLRVHPEIETGVAAVSQTLFPEVIPHFDGGWIVKTLVVSAIALALACVFFSRREVPYGAD
ncbi:MAG TPA: ABC transporter permease subunit [Thermoanaerobaculia bacterium]|nr:ABC transporter permease subunit [Thermoanaerobaculia bacterium]